MEFILKIEHSRNHENLSYFMKHAAGLFCVFLFIGVAKTCAVEAFRPGERLVYEASWGVIKAAQIEFEIANSPRNSGYPQGTLLLRGKCRSLGMVNSIYPIKSTAETYARPNSFIPIFFSEDRREGRHAYRRTMTYDFDAKIGLWSNKISGHDKRVRLPRVAYDQLGAFYALRKHGLRPDSTDTLEVIADGRYEKIKYSVSKPEKKPIGKWAPMPVISITSEDIVEHAVRRKASMQMYVTADPRHIPLQINLRASWGTVRLDLVEAAGVGESLPERESKPARQRRISGA